MLGYVSSECYFRLVVLFGNKLCSSYSKGPLLFTESWIITGITRTFSWWRAGARPVDPDVFLNQEVGGISAGPEAVFTPSSGSRCLWGNRCVDGSCGGAGNTSEDVTMEKHKGGSSRNAIRAEISGVRKPWTWHNVFKWNVSTHQTLLTLILDHNHNGRRVRCGWADVGCRQPHVSTVYFPLNHNSIPRVKTAHLIFFRVDVWMIGVF